MSAMTETVVKVRPAIFPTDKQIVSQLFLAYAESIPVKLDFQGFEEELAGLPGKYSAENNGAVFLAYTNNTSLQQESSPLSQVSETIIGVVALRHFPSPKSTQFCELKRLYLTPSSRGLGVSKQLMNAIISQARALGYQEMLLDTLSSMTNARRLYEKYGFTKIDAYYASVPDAVFYKLLL
jgi:GNAT superfamily N-acetyltransferase